jgi:hypothetical protein
MTRETLEKSNVYESSRVVRGVLLKRRQCFLLEKTTTFWSLFLSSNLLKKIRQDSHCYERCHSKSSLL